MFKIIVIVIGIGTAIAIGLNSFNLIPNVTAGDWLGFWGAYIGGVATLTGVLLTLWKGNEDKKEAEQQREMEKKEVEEKNRPSMIMYFPQSIFRNKELSKKIRVNINVPRELDVDSRAIMLRIYNVGKEHAFNVKGYIKPISSEEYEELENSVNETGEMVVNRVSSQLKNYINRLFDNSGNTRVFTIDFVQAMTDLSQQGIDILFDVIQLEKVINRIIESYNINTSIDFEIPLLRLEIQCDMINGKENVLINKYNIYFVIENIGNESYQVYTLLRNSF